MISKILVPAVAMFVGACASPDRITTSVSLSELEAALKLPAVSFSEIAVSCKVTDRESGGDPEFRITLANGGSGSVTLGREQVSPARFSFPEVPTTNGDGIFPITPVVPNAFETDFLGWSLELEATTQGGFIILTGSLTHRTLGGDIRAAGVPFSIIAADAKTFFGSPTQIVISENKALRPIVNSEVFPVTVAAIPGEDCRVYFGDGRELYADFRCTITE